MKRTPPLTDFGIAVAGCVIFYALSARYDILESIEAFCRRYERYQMDELIAVSVFLVFVLAVFAIRRWREVVSARRELVHQNEKLQKSMAEIKVLRGILPICSVCKKIRTDKGVWEQMENYIATHTDARFSHGICQDCMKKLYPEYTALGAGGEVGPC
jgi:hypothetical protein